MTTLKKVTKFFDELLQPGLFKDNCPNGLQVEGKEEVKKIGFAVTADLDTILWAKEKRVDALVCHHGLFWKGDSYALTGIKKEKISLLLDHKISLYAYHLPLDAHQEVGNNWSAARDLGWKDLAAFGQFEGQLIGVKGHFSSLPLEAFVAELESYYGHAAMMARGGKKEVSSAAIVSGGAWRMLSEAAAVGVDCFITGNFDEPAWSMAHERGLHFLALGHTATEKIGPRALAAKTAASLSLETLFIDSTNPF